MHLAPHGTRATSARKLQERQQRQIQQQSGAESYSLRDRTWPEEAEHGGTGTRRESSVAGQSADQDGRDHSPDAGGFDVAQATVSNSMPEPMRTGTSPSVMSSETSLKADETQQPLLAASGGVQDSRPRDRTHRGSSGSRDTREDDTGSFGHELGLRSAQVEEESPTEPFLAHEVDIPPESDEDVQDNSPYAQVRATVSATDNVTLSVNTPRMWTLSLLFAFLGSGANLFFSLRYPSVTISPIIALLVSHPVGLLWDRALKKRTDPAERFRDGVLRARELPGIRLRGNEETPYRKTSRRNKFRLWLGQGRWNAKEHCCVYVSSNVSFGFAFATDVIVEQAKFYHQDPGILYQLLLTLSTQIIGYTFAGLTRRYLVRPASMVWPATLNATAMFSTLHKEENKIANGWRITRWRFFLLVWLGSFAFYFLPGLLMPALSYFNVITWIAPKSVVAANLFGVSSGLGLFPLTLDWSQIAYTGSPLLTPFWAAVNMMTGLAIVLWILAPIIYYTNTLFLAYMPIHSSSVFDNEGKPYQVSKILTSDFLFDKEAYSSYSRVFLPATYVLSYAIQFASLTALVTHTICWHGRDIVNQTLPNFARRKKREAPSLFTPEESSDGESPANWRSRSPKLNRTRSSRRSRGSDDDGISLVDDDVHSRLMKRYKDTPSSWYLMIFLTTTAIGVFVVEHYPVYLPWYGLLLALSMGAILYVPIGIITAVTNQQSSFYLICQIVCGILFPGRPVANMVFVTYGFITATQGLKFSSDLKLGHYMKIPPRILFLVQIVATMVSAVTQVGVMNWMFANVRGICTPEADNGFTCPIARVHFNGSILWGVVGPGRFFGKGALYRPLLWAFPVGAVAPVIIWLIARRHGRSKLRKINLPLFFGAVSWIPPATGLNFSAWAIVCYIFNYLIRRRATAWWEKYNMTLSAALDSGLAFGVLVIFFAFVYPQLTRNFKWWGTEVFKRGCDWDACSYNTLAPGETFGPRQW